MRFTKFLIFVFVVAGLSSCTPQVDGVGANETAANSSNTTTSTFGNFNNENDIFALLGQSKNVIDLSLAKSEGTNQLGKVYVFVNENDEVGWTISTCRGKIYRLGLFNIPDYQNFNTSNGLTMNLSESAMLEKFGKPMAKHSNFVKNAIDGSKNFNQLVYTYGYTTDKLAGFTYFRVGYKENDKSKPWSISFSNVDICN